MSQYYVINELGDQVSPICNDEYEAAMYRARLEKHFTDYFSIVALEASEKPSKPRLVHS